MGRRPVREGEEDGIDAVDELALERQVGRAEVGMDAADRVAAPFAAGQPGELDGRMARQEADELAADVAGRTDDADADRPVEGARSPAGAGLGAAVRSVGVAMGA